MNTEKKDKNLPIVVIGAGPAGLTAARAISRAGRNVVVLEKRPVVGGISSSRDWQGFIMEFGPHTYHVKNDEIDEIIRGNYPGDLPVKKRVTNMLVRGKYLDYPLKFWQLFRSLNPFFSTRLVADFLFTTLKFKIFPRPDDSFETWGIKRFGHTLYNLCFGQYSRRVWGVSPAQLSVRLASSKLHKLNLKDIIIKLAGGRGQEQATYWEDFLYPEEGMGVVFENMSARLIKEGSEVKLNTFPVGFEVEAGRVRSVTVARGGREETIPCAGVISTIPLDELTRLLAHELSREEEEAGLALRNRSLILINQIYNIPRVSDAHWVYLLDPHFRCNRFCEQKNLLLDRKPHLKTLITFELCCAYGDHIWEADDSELAELARKDVKHISIIDGGRAGDCEIQKVKSAYPIYDLEFEKNLQSLLEGLSRLENFYTTGRQGLFLNTDMHDSMKTGHTAAAAFLSDTPPGTFYNRVTPHLRDKEDRP